MSSQELQLITNENTVYVGHTLDILKKLPSEIVDCVVTSPPYFKIRNYQTEGQIWDENIKGCDHQFTIKHRKRQTGGGGENTKTDIGNYKDKRLHFDVTTYTCHLCGAWKGELGLEPNVDLYINHLILIFNEIKRILKKTGTLWVNIGDSFDDHGSLMCIPESFVIAMKKQGWRLPNKIIWHKPNPLPSSAKRRFTMDYEHIFFFTKSKKYYFKTQYEPLAESTKKEIKKAYTGKGLKPYEAHGVQNPSNVKRNIIKSLNPDVVNTGIKFGGNKASGYGNPVYSGNEYKQDTKKGRIHRSIWKITPQAYRKAHFATYPEKLVQKCIDAGCKPNGLVLDPFLGSGTTMRVALKNHHSCIGIELNEDYIEFIEDRTKDLIEQTTLSGGKRNIKVEYFF